MTASVGMGGGGETLAGYLYYIFAFGLFDLAIRILPLELFFKGHLEITINNLD